MGDIYKRDGRSYHPMYPRWVQMLDRCNNPKNIRYDKYGAKGIKVDPRWLNFQTFIEDMGEPPTKYYTIERIDNDLDYTPSNCRWATRFEQNRNLSSNIWVSVLNKKVCLTDASTLIGCAFSSLTWRIRTKKETPQQAVDHFLNREARGDTQAR